MLRIERGFALLAVKFGGGKMEDFMPWVKQKNDDELGVDNLLIEMGMPINEQQQSISNEERTFRGRKIKRKEV